MAKLNLRQWGCWLRLFVVAVAISSVLIQRPAIVSSQSKDIHFDLPANGQLRVENQFGDLRVSVGKQRDVAIAVDIEGSMAAIQSPVIVETKQNLLSIAVNRQPGRQQQINLIVTIPQNTRAEFVTAQGNISSTGVPASLSLNTVSGKILAELDTPLDVDVIATSTEGTVSSGLEGGVPSSHSYRNRFGQGQKLFRANSQLGEIAVGTVESNSAAARSDGPELKKTPAVGSAAGTPATDANGEEIDEGDVIRVDAQLVTLNLSVIDRGTNKGVAGLTQPDFKLFENGVEQRILQFDSSSAPFDLVLLIDLSGSTRDVVRLIRGAARRFVDAARPSDRIAIITFAGRATVVSPLTLDRDALRERVNGIDTIAGDTKLYDAGEFAIADVARQTKNSRRTAIVLMSDGLDGSIPGVQGDGSKESYADFLNTVREFDGVLYSLWLNTYYEALNDQDTQPEAFDMGHDRMKELADAGGGMFYEVESLDDLAGAYERVVADLGTVYSLAYRPLDKKRDAKWRNIKVNLSRSNAIARGKHGYYAN
ncbi:MAG TPA: VWA domain-containing protein [Pyrinomonadaceae bacterium]|nr:VWA domain-containing protein [Pyrinomonadaceae bacterium]